MRGNRVGRERYPETKETSAAAREPCAAHIQARPDDSVVLLDREMISCQEGQRRSIRSLR